MNTAKRTLFEKVFADDAIKLWCDALNRQCAMFSPDEIDILQGLGLSDKSGPLLDLGCGIGAYSLQLKKRFPNLCIVAADTNESLLRKFAEDIRTSGARGIRAIPWRAGKAEPPPEISKCRSALLSMVLQHDPNPEAILAVLRKALPSRSSIFIIEEDDRWVRVDPPCKPLDQILGAWTSYTTAHGGTRTLASRIPRLARQAGLCIEDLRLYAHTNLKLGLEPMFAFFKATLPLLVDDDPHGLPAEQARKIMSGLDRYVEAHGRTCTLLYPKLIIHAKVP